MSITVCRAAFAVVCLCALAACSQSRVEPVTAAEESWTTDVQVAAIHVERNNPDVPAEVMNNLSTHLRTVMDECVTGERPIDLRVRLDNFEDNSTAAALLIGDTTGLSGTVLIEDPQTGGTKGEYYIDSVRSGGGIIGAIALSGSEDSMPLLFAEQLCEEVFAGAPVERRAGYNPGGAAIVYEPASPTDTAGSMTESSESNQGTPTAHIYKPPE